MPNKSPSLLTCITTAANNAELVKQFDRLNGTNLSLKGSTITILIDEATGKQKDDIKKFIAFVHEIIFLPLNNTKTEK